MDGKPDAAIQVWREALRWDPTHRPLHDSLMAELDHLGLTEECLRERHRFELLNGSPEYQMGVRALDAGDYQRSISLFRALLARHPELEAVRRKLAFALFAHEDHPACIAEYRRLLDLAPEEGDLRLSLGIALYRTGEFAASKKELESAARINPGSAKANYYLGMIHWEAGEKQRGMQLFHAARRLDPNITIPH